MSVLLVERASFWATEELDEIAWSQRNVSVPVASSRAYISSSKKVVRRLERRSAPGVTIFALVLNEERIEWLTCGVISGVHFFVKESSKKIRTALVPAGYCDVHVIFYVPEDSGDLPVASSLVYISSSRKVVRRLERRSENNYLVNVMRTEIVISPIGAAEAKKAGTMRTKAKMNCMLSVIRAR